MKDYLVKDWMKRDPITISSNTAIPNAYWKMMDNKIRRLLVVDNGELVGIVTANDLRQKIPYTTFAIDILQASDALAHCPVKKVMTPKPFTIAEGEHLIKAAQLMIDNHISTLPVINKQGALCGIITESDIFRAFVDIFRKF